MQLSVLTQPQLVQRFAAGAQAAASTVLDFTVGSVFDALAEANAALALWFQWLLLQVLGTSRLGTSTGADVDSFVAQFPSITRLPASPAVGSVTFSRYTPTNSALVGLGVQVKTADGTRIFAVYEDDSNPAWSANSGSTPGYVLAPGQASVTVPAIDVTTDASGNPIPGTAGNVAAGTITLLTSAVPGVDTVNNPLAFTGGIDAESDAALAARFQGYIEGLSAGTAPALLAAALSVQQGITAQVVTFTGGATVYVDDGTGSPPASLIAAVFAACDAKMAVGATLAVLPPIVAEASISVVFTYGAGATRASATGAAAAALTTFISSLATGQATSTGRLYQVALNAAQPYGATDALISYTLLDNAAVVGQPGTVIRLSSLSVV